MKTLYARCENGHFFDANKTDNCPKCGSNVYTLPGEKVNKRKGSREIKSRREKFTWKSKKEKEICKDKNNELLKDEENRETISDIYKFSAVTDEFSKTISFASSLAIDTGNEKTATVKLVGDKKDDNDTDILHENRMKDDVKTIAFWDKDEKQGIEPTVGWLVCVKGSDAGKSFELKTGVNRIGRNSSCNDIAISGDIGISGKEHFIIAFEPKKRRFYIQQGESMNLTYLNGELLDGNNVLNRYDRVELGASRLIFIPLCGDNFDWSELKGE